MLCVKFSSTSKTSFELVPQPLISKSTPPWFLLPFFQRISHPPSGLNSRIHPLIFLFLSYIPPWSGNIFKFMVFILLENKFMNHNIESRHFYSCPPSPGKTLPQVLTLIPGRGKLPIHHKVFF